MDSNFCLQGSFLYSSTIWIHHTAGQLQPMDLAI